MLIWPPVRPACAAPTAVAPAAVAGAAAVGAVTVGLAVVGAGAAGDAGPHAATIVPSAETPPPAASIRKNARRLCPWASDPMCGCSGFDRVFTILVLLICVRSG